jgi:hypothetical protein
MLVDHLGEAVIVSVNHLNCRTKVKMDDLWQCLVGTPICCPDLIIYGPIKYCLHTDHVKFGASTERIVEGSLE